MDKTTKINCNNLELSFSYISGCLVWALYGRLASSSLVVKTSSLRSLSLNSSMCCLSNICWRHLLRQDIITFRAAFLPHWELSLPHGSMFVKLSCYSWSCIESITVSVPFRKYRTSLQREQTDSTSGFYLLHFLSLCDLCFWEKALRPQYMSLDPEWKP